MSDFYKKVNVMETYFANEFTEVYRKLNKKSCKKLLQFLHPIHRRWFYSTLIEPTPFTPASFTNALAIHYGDTTSNYPVLVLDSNENFTGINCKIANYSSKEHEAVYDLKKLVECANPHLDILNPAGFLEENKSDILGKLSLSDDFYGVFLLEISLHLKLLVKTPSLYVNRLVVGSNFDEFFERPHNLILYDIIDATLALASLGLRDCLPVYTQAYSVDFLKELLKTPKDLRDILNEFFNSCGYDYEDIRDFLFSADVTNIDEEDPLTLVATSTHVIEVMLDRYFFTPFGYFLKMVNPYYGKQFMIYEQIERLVLYFDDIEEANLSLFLSPINYTLTELALELFETKKTKENYYDTAEIEIWTLLDKTFMNEQIFKIAINHARASKDNIMAKEARIFVFKVTSEKKPSSWINIKAKDVNTLLDIYKEIEIYYDLQSKIDFSFYHDTIENPFAEFPSEKRNNKSRNQRKTVNEVKLSELNFEEKGNMLLVIKKQGIPFYNEAYTEKFNIEFLEKEPYNKDEDYPYVSTISKSTKDQIDGQLDGFNFPWI